MSTVKRTAVIGYATATSGYRDAELARRTEMLEALLPPGMAVEAFQLPGPEFLDRAEHFDEAIAAAAEWTASLSPDKYDVLVSAGAIDPGLPQLRKIAPIPVVGPGEASMFLGHALGKRLSIVTVDEYAVARIHPFLEQTAVKPEIASVRSVEYPVRRIMGDVAGAQDALRRECRAAVESDGAGALMLGAMTLGSLGIADELRETLGVPVINPLEAAIQAAVAVVRSLVPGFGSG